MTRSIDFDEYDDDPEYRSFLRRSKTIPRKAPSPAPAATTVDELEDADFRPTFSSSKHERAWILNYLRPFYDDHLITDVLRQVKGGKEATVYCCRAHRSTGRDLLAAKVYRPREFRTIRNDAVYREGRLVTDRGGKHVMRDRRALAAVAGKTKMGREILHATWLGQEFEVMKTLHAAGAQVPKPWARGENAIVMDYIGDEGFPAPTLHGVTLDRLDARRLFDRLVHDLEILLRHGIVHGDLSPYNILYWEDAATIIDFPQAVDTAQNPSAQSIFQRDVTRLCQYFARQGVDADPRRLAADLWRTHVQLGYDS